jgi:hypothetical protein
VADNTNPLGLTEGTQVVDREGAELGKIAAVRGGYFKVEVSMGIDYWLRQDIVAESDSKCVKLRLPQSEVDEQRIESGAEDLFETHDDASDAKPELSGSERRYDTQADALLHGRPLI